MTSQAKVDRFLLPFRKMERLRDHMTPRSKALYLFWRARRSKSPVIVKLKTSERIMLRPEPTDDLGVAVEVFVNNLYKLPEKFNPRNIRLIVDVGANVGFTCLLWLRSFPRAQVIAFEPHPSHVSQIHLHLKLNRCEKKVTLYPVAAGTHAGQVSLVDDGCRSAITQKPVVGSISVEMVDWFSIIGAEHIDILKIDIEGGEYAILADPRFEALTIRAVVLEWHKTPDHPDGREWCYRRLTQLGYEVSTGRIDSDRNGMLWAFREDLRL